MTSTTRVSNDKCPRSIQTPSISFIFNKNFTRLPCRTTKDKRRHIFKKVVIVLGKDKTDFGFKSSFVSFSQQKRKRSFRTRAKKKREISCWILHTKSSLKFPSTFPVDFCWGLQQIRAHYIFRLP